MRNNEQNYRDRHLEMDGHHPHRQGLRRLPEIVAQAMSGPKEVQVLLCTPGSAPLPSRNVDCLAQWLNA